MQEKRTVLCMTPCEGYPPASFILGEKAVKDAPWSDLRANVLEIMDSAKKNARGRGIRLEVRETGDVNTIEKLAVIKIKN